MPVEHKKRESRDDGTGRIIITVALISLLLVIAGAILVVIPRVTLLDKPEPVTGPALPVPNDDRTAYQQPPVPGDAEHLINAIISNADKNAVAVNLPWGDTLSVADIESLQPGLTPTTNVIRQYIRLLTEARIPPNPPGSFMPHVFIYPVAFWEAFQDGEQEYQSVSGFTTAQTSPMALQNRIVLIPVRIDDQKWGVVYVTSTEMYLCDALGSNPTPVLDRIKRYVNAEREAKFPGSMPLTWNRWKTGNKPYLARVTLPYDNPIFMLVAADHLRRGLPTDMAAEDMNYYRSRIAYELITGELLPPVITPEFAMMITDYSEAKYHQ